jgi:hypothetical protein
MKTKKQMRMKYKQSTREYKKKSPCGGEILRTRPGRSWGPPSLIYNVYLIFLPGGIAAGVWH